MDDIVHQLALSLIKGVGFTIWKSLINKVGSASDIYKLSKSELHSLINSENICNSIICKSTLSESEKIIEEHLKSGVSIVSFFSDRYPYRLKELCDAPCFLYIKGENILNNVRMLSVIGTRDPTQYGVNNCKVFVSGLKDFDVTIISGLAYGIDVISHQEALNSNMSTVAVLAGGVDNIYPSIHKPVYDKIIESGGCVVSEFPLGVKPDKFRFPLRNRIIAGLSDGILIVESGEKSGTQITALCGNDYNKEVFAIPGDINSSKSKGCNNLIKENKAILVTEVSDITDNLNWGLVSGSEVKSSRSIDLDEDSLVVYNFIKDNKSVTFDEIYECVDIDSSKISSILLSLEVNKLVRLLPGDKYSV